MRTRGNLIAAAVLACLLAALTPYAATASPPDGQGVGANVAPRSATTKVLRHASIYRAKPIKSRGCVEQVIPLDSVGNVRAYYQHVFGCLNRDWKRVVKSAGRRFHKPRLVVWSGTTKHTKCGSVTAISFYCGAGRGTLYMYADEMIRPWLAYPGDPVAQQEIRLSATHTIAHEYGHHVQSLSGILSAYDRASGRAKKSKAAGLEKRLELQATCFGDLFLTAESASYPVPAAMLSDWTWPIIYVANHGSEASQRYWITRARGSARTKVCNTWKAPASTVS